jgi:hypothetical protein
MDGFTGLNRGCLLFIRKSKICNRKLYFFFTTAAIVAEKMNASEA